MNANNDMTIRQRRKHEECQSCIQLLQNVLFSMNTKSSKLLQNIANIHLDIYPHDSTLNTAHDDDDVDRTRSTGTSTTDHLRIISNGVQVRIPQKQQQQQQEIYTIDTTTTSTNDSSIDDSNILATTTASHHHHITNNTNDWIDITCRTCSDFGPEANARAFVMGPTPLSIVICHNRISSIATAKSSTQEPSPSLSPVPTTSTTTTNNTSAAYVTPIWNQLKTRLTTSTKTPSNFVVDTDSMTSKPPPPTTTTVGSSMDTASANTTMMIQEMDEIITHELIHIYDVRQLQLNLIHCHDLAYSEIRAAREAECSHHWNTIRSHHHNDNGTAPHQQQPLMDCVRTRATTATKNIFPSYRAHQCIQNVYPAAMADLRPFSSLSPPAAATTTTSTTFRNHHPNHRNMGRETSRTMEEPYASKK